MISSNYCETLKTFPIFRKVIIFLLIAFVEFLKVQYSFFHPEVQNVGLFFQG